MRRLAVCFILFVLEIGLAHAQAGRKVPPRRVKPNATPAAPVGTLPLLPRFWQLADSAERADAAEVFKQYLQQFIAYPALALQAGVGGAIYALLTVLPDGRVGGISITRRKLSAGSPPIKAVLALDAELQRVAWQLRFKPAAARIDSSAFKLVAQADTLATPIVQTDSTEISTYVQDDVAVPVLLADTVTIFHRFVPQ